MRTLSPSLPISPCRSCDPLKSCKVAVSGDRLFGIRRIGEIGSNGVHRKLSLGAVNANFSRPSVREIFAPPPPPAAAIEAEELKNGSSFLFRTEAGWLVKVSVSKKKMKKKKEKYAVCVDVSSMELGMNGDCSKVKLVWGMYSSDSSDEMIVDTLLMRNSISGFSGELEFEEEQSPFYLSFILKSVSGIDGSELEIRSHRKTKFCVPIGFGRGSPAPLGLSFPADGSVNFALFSKNSKNVVLCLYDDASIDKPALELDLDSYVNRTGDIWHASFEDVSKFHSYGFRCKGIEGDTDQSNAGRVLLDPYAKAIVDSKLDDHGLSKNYLGRLCKELDFDWSGDVHPNLPLEKLVVYRLNIKRFTQHRSSNVVSGFAGVADKVKHFKDLGVNAVLIEPIFPFDDRKGPYSPHHFFSPSNLYGSSSSGDSMSAISSMKEMVKRLHANGIEVFMEVVFSHTAESGALQGIDDSSYYYDSESLNCNYPVVTRMILDSLKHWVAEYRIDGFCFLNASSLLRGFHGESLSRPPLIEAITFDPLLSRTKIVADFWDPQMMLMKEEARFPHWKRWAEMNTRFCNDVRYFIRGEGHLSSLATRLCGSGDIFSSGRGPCHGFNFISRNSGFTLVDLVSFSSGDNLAHELSWNCGEEGPTGKTLILERRLKQTRNYLFILFVSLGVPVLNMGDECGESTGGSGNRKPLDWNAFSAGFGIQTTEFISFLTTLRARRSDLLQKGNFLDEKNIEWYGNDQSPPKWDDPSSKFLAMGLKTNKPESSEEQTKGDLFMAFNAGRKSADVALPRAPEGMKWRRLVDTALPYPGFFSNDGEIADEDFGGSVVYEMKSHSCVLFEAGNGDD
ncbi:Isoamylase 2, chloroplastic [Linum perenne]